jgi:hypothetical protein
MGFAAYHQCRWANEKMPVTPFHGGVGLLAKGIARGRISFVAFCAAQVLIDLESGYFLLTDDWPFHRFLHTLIGAAAACGAAVWLCRLAARWWTGRPDSTSVLMRLARRDLDVLLTPAGVVGTCRDPSNSAALRA